MKTKMENKGGKTGKNEWKKFGRTANTGRRS
jgi:hypothetical protein